MGKKKHEAFKRPPKGKQRRELEGRQLMLNRVDAKLQAMFAKQTTISASQLAQALLSIGYEIRHTDNTVLISGESPFARNGLYIGNSALFRDMSPHMAGIVPPPAPAADAPFVVQQSGTLLMDGIATHDAKKGEAVRIQFQGDTKVHVQAGQGLERSHAAAVAASNLEQHIRRVASGGMQTPPEVADRLKANHIATVQPRTRHRPKVAKKAPAKRG